MRVRIPLVVRRSSASRSSAAAVAAVLTLGLATAIAPAASAAPTAPAAAVCRPAITVLPLPTWAVGGTVNDAAAGTAVGSVTLKNGKSRAMRWVRSGARWRLSPIPGVDALGVVPVSSATGVNRHGAITVSVYAGVSSAPRAFVAAGGLLQPLLDGAGGTSAYAADISDSGLVVGSAYSVPEYRTFAVRWDYWDQRPRALGYGGGSSSSAEAIDDADDIGGWTFGTPNSGGAAFRVDGDGATMPLGGLVGAAGPSVGTVTDLNPSERTVGHYVSSVGQGAAVWDNGVLRLLPRFVGGDRFAPATATGVSNAGMVVGYEDERPGSESPLVRHVLVYTDADGVRSLLPPSRRWTDPATANTVDEVGTVYGSGYSTSLSQHPGEMVPTAWTCAAQQAFAPTATGVPAGTPTPEVVRD